jgi:hypothetical protein
MNTLREAVARAIEAERWRIALEMLQGADIPSMDGSRRTADAAIAAVLEAMGEPSEGMKWAGWGSKADVISAREGHSPGAIWSAMLAAFREEQSNGH